MILSEWRLSGWRLKKKQSPQFCHTPHGEVALMHLLIKKDSEKKTVAVALSPLFKTLFSQGRHRRLEKKRT